MHLKYLEPQIVRNRLTAPFRIGRMFYACSYIVERRPANYLSRAERPQFGTWILRHVTHAIVIYERDP